MVDTRHAQEFDGLPSGYWIEWQSQQNLLQLIDFMNTENWGMVALNYISLELGGVFDITGNWQGSHFEHREGKHVDISFNRAGNIVTVANQRRIYNRICDRSATGPNIAATIYYHDNDATPHFHVRLRAEKACSKTSGPAVPPRPPVNNPT